MRRRTFVKTILAAFLICSMFAQSGVALAATKTWDFSTSSDYDFDTGKVEISGGTASLAATTTADWYGDDWTKRKEVTVDNTSGTTTLTNYQVKVVVTYDADMQADFDDIRFTDGDGTTALSYWLESKTDSTSATFWVKVPTIETSSTHSIYLYYGNSGAASASDGDATFHFFDGFESSAGKTPAVTFGLLTSVEYGDDDNRAKLQEAVNVYNDADVDFVVEDGDFLDYNDALGGVTREQMLVYLDEIESVYDNLTMPRYYTFGNHDLDYISKQDFLDHTGKDTRYESFDSGDYHFVILDADYRSDNDADEYDSGNFDYRTLYIPPAERAWLENDLASTSKKTFVFVEQLLADMTPTCQLQHMVDNSDVIRGILEDSNKVLAVFSGHCGLNVKTVVNGIQYFDLSAMDHDGNAYSKVTIYDDDTFDVLGYGTQTSYSNAGTYDSTKWALEASPQVSSVDSTVIVGSDTLSAWEGIISRVANAFDSGVAEFRFPVTPGVETAIGILKPGMADTDRYGVVISPPATDPGNEIRRYSNNINTPADADLPTGAFTGKIAWSGTNYTVYYDDTAVASGTLATTDLNLVVESYKANNIWLDWTFVRTYAAVEPTVSFGSEEDMNSYPSDDPSVSPKAVVAQSFTSLSGIASSETTNGGSVKYQVSNDGGVTWYWYDGGWSATTAGSSEANSIADINTHLASLPVGSGLFLFKAYLGSDGTHDVSLDSVMLTYADAGGTSPAIPTTGAIAPPVSSKDKGDKDDNTNDQVHDEPTEDAVDKTISPVYIFLHDLSLGVTAPDVLALQRILNAQGFTLALSGAGSPGHETDYFGALTRNALMRFQQTYSITPANGYFGPITRGFMTVLLLNAAASAQSSL